MSSYHCLLIDDIAAATESFTPFGRSLVQDSVSTIRDRTLAYCAKRGWTVIPYATYVAWAYTHVADSARRYLVLDPLFPVRESENMRPLRLSRPFGAVSPLHEGVPDDAFRSGSMLGVLDDAASSGNTLRYVARLAAERCARVDAVAVCASSRFARDSFRRLSPNTLWHDYVPGDWNVAHLRDGCPFLPFSGRPARQPVLAREHGPGIEERIPSFRAEGSLWAVLMMNAALNDAVRCAGANIAQALSSHLGRKARVSDLVLFGSKVTAWVEPTAAVSRATLVEDLIAG